VRTGHKVQELFVRHICRNTLGVAQPLSRHDTGKSWTVDRAWNRQRVARPPVAGLDHRILNSRRERFGGSMAGEPKKRADHARERWVLVHGTVGVHS
jgi:hypothetical protein